MEGKLTASAGIASLVSSFRRLCRSSSPLCCGVLAFSLVHLTQVSPPAIRANPDAEKDAGKLPSAESLSPALTSHLPGLPPPADTPSTAEERVFTEEYAAVTTAAASVDSLERIHRAADLMAEVNTAFGVPRSPYGQLIYDIAVRHSINPHLVAAMIHVESAFRPNVVSRKGACGLMQLLPATARRFGVRKKKDLFDPVKNMEAGVRYLKWLTQRFDGDVEKILAAYNAGEGAVERYGGVPPYRETQRYVEKVFQLLGFRKDRPAEEAAAPGGIVAAGK